MFKSLCLLLVAVLSLGYILRLDHEATYELPFWLSLAVCIFCFFLTFYYLVKTLGLPKETRTPLSALKKTDD